LIVVSLPAMVVTLETTEVCLTVTSFTDTVEVARTIEVDFSVVVLPAFVVVDVITLVDLTIEVFKIGEGVTVVPSFSVT
jgi:hypothetical protein